MVRKVVFFLVIAVLVSSCGAKLEAAQIIEPNWQLVWEEDFDSRELWGLSTDASVGCSPISESDIDYGIVDVKTPSGDRRALMLLSNSQGRPGVFMNAISHREIDYLSRVQYKLEGTFRVPPGADPAQFTDIAFNFVTDGVGHSAEIFFGTDPLAPQYYGWINVRNGRQGHINLIDLRDSINDWHHFEMVVSIYEDEGIFIIDWIRVDDQLRILGWEMPIFPKEGWPRVAQVYIEQHNQFRNCSEKYSSIGVSQWDELRLYQAPIGYPRLP